MNIKISLTEAFQFLHEKHGTHTAAAKAVGLTREHYRAIRNGKYTPPKRTADYIRFVAMSEMEAQ